MSRHLLDNRTFAMLGLVTCLTLGATSADARRGRGSDDVAVGQGHRQRNDGSPDARVDAGSFFAACPDVRVTRETSVRGRATVVGDCTITVDGGRNLELVEVDLEVLGNLAIAGDGDVDVSIGDEDCPDGQLCVGSRIDAATVRVDVTGRDGRVRIFFSRIVAGAIDLSVGGTDAEVRVHNSTLDADSYIMLAATGTDARTRVDVVNEGGDRNALSAHTVIVNSEGGDSETRVEDTVFEARRVMLGSSGEAHVERNAFGDASVSLSADDCHARNNVPSVACD